MVAATACALAHGAFAQWSAAPGETVRNGFGPQKGLSAPACRGACGMDCPSSCDTEVRFECAGENELLRVNAYSALVNDTRSVLVEAQGVVGLSASFGGKQIARAQKSREE